MKTETKTVILTLNLDFPLSTAGNNIVIKYDLLKDIIFSMGDCLSKLQAGQYNEVGNGPAVIENYKLYNFEAYNALLSTVYQKVFGVIISDSIPETVNLTLSDNYVKWLTYNENYNYQAIGKILRQRGNCIALPLGFIRNRLSTQLVEKSVNLFKSDANVTVFTIVGSNNRNSEIARRIYQSITFGEFKPYYDAFIQCILGNAYFYGIGVAEDVNKALASYENAIKGGSGEAANQLGNIYLNGRNGVPKNYSKAFSYFNTGVEYQNSEAFSNLGYCYENALGTDPDYDKALKYYELGVKSGDPVAFQRLADYYFKGKGGSTDYEKAYLLYREISEQDGQLYSAYKTGLMLMHGLGVEKAPEEAFYFFEKAASENIEFSCFYCGQLIEAGFGNENNNTNTAIEYYKKGTKNHRDYKSATELAIRKKGSADPDLIIKLLKWGTDKGYGKAQYELGRFLQNLALDTEMPELIEDGKKLISMAAEQGYLPAKEFFKE